MGAVQGIAEFLPISSSSHLILLPWLFHWEDPGLTFDVALHLGTLAAVALYFFGDWMSLIKGACRNPRSEDGRMLALLAAATVPGGLAGLLLEKYAESAFRAPPLMAANLIGFGLLMEWAARSGAKNRSMESLQTPQALKIGTGQALAIIPGVSRSGITITVGLWEGLTAEAAARFSFLLSMPITFGAAAHKLRHLNRAALDAPFLTGVAVSALTGMVAIHFLLRYFRHSGTLVFTVYRVILGTAIIALYYLR